MAKIYRKLERNDEKPRFLNEDCMWVHYNFKYGGQGRPGSKSEI